MKRIFEVNGEFFATKKEAKVARGEKIVREDKTFYYKYTVKRGPDHFRGKTT